MKKQNVKIVVIRDSELKQYFKNHCNSEDELEDYIAQAKQALQDLYGDPEYRNPFSR
ncbi:MAG: hypothetical protein ACXVNM_01600 [Bacteroidia bacterium]